VLLLFIDGVGCRMDNSQSRKARHFKCLPQSLKNFLVEDDAAGLEAFLAKCYPHNNDRTTLKALLLAACREGKLQIARYVIEKRFVSPILFSEPRGKEQLISLETLDLAAASGNAALVKYLVEECKVDETFLNPMWNTKRYDQRANAISAARQNQHDEIAAFLSLPVQAIEHENKREFYAGKN